ncbi:hypothetical protein QBC39DRAFT_279003, partial [Podospora conica]
LSTVQSTTTDHHPVLDRSTDRRQRRYSEPDSRCTAAGPRCGIACASDASIACPTARTAQPDARSRQPTENRLTFVPLRRRCSSAPFPWTRGTDSWVRSAVGFWADPAIRHPLPPTRRRPFPTRPSAVREKARSPTSHPNDRLCGSPAHRIGGLQRAKRCALFATPPRRLPSVLRPPQHRAGAACDAQPPTAAPPRPEIETATSASP